MATSKATLGSRWASVTDVTGRLVEARDNRASQDALLASIDDRVQRRRNDVEQSLQAIPAAERGRIANRTLSGFRNELKRSTAPARADHLRTADRIRRETAPAAAHYQSPVQMLMRDSLGSERRSRILQQIEHSGPAELGSLAEFAAATGDKELAAALCSRTSTLKAVERPFDPRELAEVLCGEDYRRVTAALMEIDRLTEEAMAKDHAFERGRASGHTTIKLALMQQAEEEVGADLSDPSAE